MNACANCGEPSKGYLHPECEADYLAYVTGQPVPEQPDALRGTVTYDGRTVALTMPDTIAAHPRPGTQQWLGEVAHDDCLPGGGLIRLELPNGQVIEGSGSVDATRSLGRSWLKIHIRVPVKPLT